jgi:branched-chain amino acid transport system permease protein
VLGGFIVLIVVAFPKGIVGTLEAIRHRRQSALAKAAPLTSSAEAAK